MAPPKPWRGGNQESGGYCEACSRGREGNYGATGGSCIGFKGCEYHGILQGVQAKTADKAGCVIPVEITVYDNKSFTFILKTPPASVLLKKAAGVEQGSKEPKLEKVGKITIDQLRAIAKEKLSHLNCTTIESAIRIVAGTPANMMGIYIDPPVLEPKKALV